jgi:hypothetical protein
MLFVNQNERGPMPKISDGKTADHQVKTKQLHMNELHRTTPTKTLRLEA